MQAEHGGWVQGMQDAMTRLHLEEIDEAPAGGGSTDEAPAGRRRNDRQADGLDLGRVGRLGGRCAAR